tara:strand:- start:452 stop:688 length:237 start_codon:yes stop_codon:yes gene_type:complete
MSKIQVEGYRTIVRDTRSGAIINTDRSAYAIHCQRIKEARESQNDLRNAVRDINNLKAEMFEIKKILQGMVSKWQQDK